MNILLNRLVIVCCLISSFISCKKDPEPFVKSCQLTSLQDDGGTFTNNSMSFDYSADGRISKINGNVFSYVFEFVNDSVTISVYDHFQSLISSGIAKLNSHGLIEWQRDTFFLIQSSALSTYVYDNNGLLLTWNRLGNDSVSHNFTYSNSNAVSATVVYNATDTIFYSYEYSEGTINNLLILPPDADDIMLSKLYGKISINLMNKLTTSSSFGTFYENYEYQLDDSGNPTRRYEIFLGDTLGITTLQWNCN